MKIISLNTWAGALLELLINFLESNKDVDVFCLQEIYSNAKNKAKQNPELKVMFEFELFEKIVDILKETHIGYFRPSYSDFYGQAIFVKNSIQVEEEGDVLIYENNKPERRGQHSRNLQYIKIKNKDRYFLIANIHGLWNGQGKTDTDDRILQSESIKNFINNRNEENKIILGDFNLIPNTKSISIVQKGMRNLIEDYGIKSTRTSYYNQDNKFADYVFVSPDLNISDFKVLPDEVSDHSPLYLEI